MALICLCFFNNSLTSNASGVAVATTTRFDWTGSHTFTGNFIANNASSTFTGDLNIGADATITANLIIGTNSFSAPTNTLSVVGDSYFQGGVTTTATIDSKQYCIDGTDCQTDLIGGPVNRVSATTNSCSASASVACSATVDCATGQVLTGGGCQVSTQDDQFLNLNYASDANTWTCGTEASTDTGATYNLTAHGICINQ